MWCEYMYVCVDTSVRARTRVHVYVGGWGGGGGLSFYVEIDAAGHNIEMNFSDETNFL